MEHCKHRVMDKCRVTGGPCTFGEDCFDPEVPLKRTNADRIRSMSDDELAEFLCSLIPGDACDFRCPGHDLCGIGLKGLEKWLRQPEEEA